MLLIFLLITVGTGAADTITVDGSGGADYTSIQEAINFAQENDSILIYKGNYSETLTVDKQLKISSISRNPEDVIINPEISSRSVIHVTSDNIEITGLSILGNNKENQASGILLNNVSNSLVQNNIISNVQDGLVLNASSGCSIKNNTLLSNNLHGIYLINSMHNDLRNNFITGNKFGLYLNLSNQNILVDNNASNNENYGIAFRKSNANNLTNNQFFMNKYGLCLTVSQENVIVDNVAGNNKQSGFLLWISESNNLKDNILIENENSGVYLLASDTNTLIRNALSNNSNGISIEDSSNNLVINNTFSSNKEYGLFYLYDLNKNNTIKENIFLNNKKGDDNLTYSSISIYIILILLTGTGFAYYLMKRSLLKKALTGLGILIVISLIAIVVWYFPFESGLSGNNVEVTNFSWYNSSKINETHTRVTLSMDINYMNKKAYDYSFAENSQTDVIPTRVQIFFREYKPDVDTEIPYLLIYEEDLNLTYHEPFRYETTLDLENNLEHDVQTIILFKREFDYPNPYGEESRWEQLGGWQQLIST
jgi:parallel beta-helix repeat protein